MLILEDNPADAELIKRELRRAGIVFISQLVDGKKEFSKALTDSQPQVILSDFKLPRFDGLAALEMTRLLAPDTPFIFVSGSIGEDSAIETLAMGVSDYIFKDNLARLGPAVKRVVAETRLKLEKKISDEELRRHVEELRLLAEAADRFVQINDLDKIYAYLANTIQNLSGADYLILSLYDEKLQAVRPKIVTGFKPFRESIRHRFHINLMEMVFYLKDMSPDDFSDFVSRRLVPARDGLHGLSNRKLPRALCQEIENFLTIGNMYVMGFSWENQLYGGLTVWFKKGNELKNPAQIEALLNQAAVTIKRLLAEQALRESEKKYRTLVTQSPDGIFVIDLQGNFLSVNQAMCAGLKYSEAEFLSKKIWDIVPKQFMELHKKRLADILKGEAKNEAAEYVVRGKEGETHYISIVSAPFYKDNELIGFQGIARDITEKKKIETRLRESEEYYRTLVETSPDAIIIVDGGGRVTFASQKAYEIFGIPSQTSIKGISFLDFVEPGEIPQVQERLVEILSGRTQPQTREYRLLGQDLRPFWGEISSAPLRDAAGRNVGLLLVLRDISERKQAEDALSASDERLRDIIFSMGDWVWEVDEKGVYTFSSGQGLDLLGSSNKDIIGKTPFSFMPPEEAKRVKTLFAEIVAKKAPITDLENWNITQHGERICLLTNAVPILDKEGNLRGYRGVDKDITARKQAEELIKASLKEKEVLLQEIHHRVKNNLQIISGLLTLQADQSAGKSLSEIFQESQDRIRSIALVHEKLYRSHNLAEIAFDEYLRSLVENLFTSQGIAAGRITLKYEMEPILFTIEKAIPLGLIVNELVTNALKHAFPSGRQGEIRIGLHGYKGAKSYALKTDSGTLHCTPTCELIVADNGVGLPPGFKPDTQKSLGMNLVSMLAKQLQAELKIITGPGTGFRLLFPGLPESKDAKDKAHDD